LSGVTTVVFGPDVRDAAARATTQLLWLLDAGAVPNPDTLDALIEARHVPAASLPVDGADDPVEAAVGRFATLEPGALLEAAQARRVPLRHTLVTSLLVSRDSVLDIAPPDPARFGRYASSEWTARLFARHPATLVPASTVRVGPLGAARPHEALRAARAAGWGRGETLRELYRSVAGGR
jgi:GT2 family glycosyltransferase